MVDSVNTSLIWEIVVCFMIYLSKVYSDRRLVEFPSTVFFLLPCARPCEQLIVNHMAAVMGLMHI